MSEEQVSSEENTEQENEEQVEGESTDETKTEDEVAKLRAIAQRRKEQLEEQKGKLEELQKSQPQKDGEDPYAERIERLELRQKGYSDKVIDEIMSLGGTKALEKDVVKKAVETMTAEEKAEQAADMKDEGTSDVTKKYSKEELQKMPLDELEKIIKNTK